MTAALTVMLDAQTFIPLLAKVLSSLAAVFASLIALFEVYYLNKKLKAEAKLLKILLSQWTALMLERQKNEKIQNLYMMNFAWVDPEMFEARNEIESALKQLPESDRHAILEGLRQPSEKGRDEYIRKLLTKVRTQWSMSSFP